MGTASDRYGALAGQPCVVVALDDDAAYPDPGTLPVVLVGIAPPDRLVEAPTVFDILLTDLAEQHDPELPAPWVGSADLAGALVSLQRGCRVSPLAATALAQLLRYSPATAVADALVAESAVYSMLQSGPEHGRWLASRAVPAPPAPDDEPPVLTSRTGPTLAITLNRPAKHNAYNAAMRDALVEALQFAAIDPTISDVRLAGNGPSFCSGGDLTEFGTRPDGATAHAVRTTRGAALWMHRSAERITVRLHGHCIGAGVELAAFAGRVAAASGTTFQLPEVGLGLIPGAGGTVSLPRRIGRQRTAWLAVTGRTIDVATAQAWGLVDALDDEATSS